GRFVDQLAARGVDDPDARLAPRESRVVEQIFRFRRGRQVQRQVVRGRADLVERHQLDAEAGGNLFGNIRVVGDDAHAEGAGALRHFLADAAQTGDAER